MKRPLQLSLAIALALGGTNALALGLGPVHVKSKLNQPLDAEIPVIQGSAGEAEGLLVNLAAAEDFDRVGINRARLTVPLEFALVKGAHGDMVIKVTSKEIVRDTYLDFLVEANWPKGRLLREYTLLLDPPVTAPATRGTTTTAVVAAPNPVTVKRHEAPAASMQAPPPPPPPPAHATVKAASHAPAVPAPARKASNGEYGPVAAGETLSAIARATRPGGVNVDQMMLALLKGNPNAFYKDNINTLKRGAILRVPSADEAKAIGSISEAAAQVHSQIEDWRGGRASPTLVADAGSSKASTPSPVMATTAAKPAKTTAAAGKAGSERLELVPPKAGKDSLAMADRPGSGAGSAAATIELKSELARTRETLTTREQEAGELKSRVKELEDLKGKNDRLIGLKDSEIADLQQKLKQLQDKSAASATKPATAPAAAAPVSTPSSTIGTAPATPVTAPATVTPSTATASSPAVTVPSRTPAPAAKIDKQDIWGEPGSSSTIAIADAGKSTPAPGSPATGGAGAAGSAAAPATPASPTPISATTPLPATPPTTSTPNGSSSAVVKPVPKATTPAKTAITKRQPAPVEMPWYEAPWVKPAALGAGVLLVLAGLLGMRKRKVEPASAGRGSIADAFGDSPLDPASGSAGSVEAEEASLREQLQLDPTNAGLHLELLSLYYADRDVARFEDAAADMHVHVEDPHQPEWLEAQAMGQELAPHNPLFSDAAHYDHSDAVSASAHADTVERPRFDDRDDVAAHAHDVESPGAAHVQSDAGFGLNLDPTDSTAAPALPVTSVAKHDESFGFTLPPLDIEAPVTHDTYAAAPAVSPAVDLDDDYFPGDDVIGTKLDLAKAYMDMGDPEGARSMLEEVVAEGSDAQKAEAHRLIAEIH